MTPTASAARAALDEVVREHRSRILASLIRAVGGDFELAEDCLHDAFATALVAWERELPDSPAGWIVTTARRRAIDRVRRKSKGRSIQQQLAALHALEPASYELDQPQTLSDDRLRLIFTCCHPALAIEAQLALTLQTLCGLDTE